jgi:outer membrane lipoprotein LolB
MISGCATKPNIPSDNSGQVLTLKQRTEQILKHDKWQLKGKIAFIQQVSGKSKRESASLTWRVNEKKLTQELNLTSYLGINVLHLKSNQDQHLIKVDGKEYRGTDLSRLIYTLTGLILPTQALNFWLRGLPYNQNDQLEINKLTQLPQSISSYYQNSLWQINYNDYKTFDGIKMATKFTIKKNGLVIKVAAYKWSLTD